MINDLAAMIHENAKSKGWWSEGDRNFGETLALIHQELSEAFEEYRQGRRYDEVYHKTETNGLPKPEGIPVEMCDALIRILDFLAWTKIDIEQVLAEKITYNTKRPYRHGGLKA